MKSFHKNILCSIIIILLLTLPLIAEENTENMVLKKTDTFMDSILFSNGELNDVLFSDSFFTLMKKYESSEDLNEFSVAIQSYLMNINSKLPLTSDLSKEICFVINAQLVLYCVFSDILFSYSDESSDLKAIIYSEYLSVPSYFSNEILFEHLNKESHAVKYAMWINQVYNKSCAIFETSNEKDKNRSFLSIFIDDNYSKEVSSTAVQELNNIIGNDINYEWKMAIIEWVNLLKIWDDNKKKLNNVVEIFKKNEFSDTKAISNLEKFITAANQWIRAKDEITRAALFDAPIRIYSWKAYFSCQEAKAGFGEDEDKLTTIGIQYAKASPFISYLVFDASREDVSITKKCLKGNLKEQEYDEMIAWCKVIPFWFEKPKLIDIE